MGGHTPKDDVIFVLSIVRVVGAGEALSSNSIMYNNRTDSGDERPRFIEIVGRWEGFQEACMHESCGPPVP